MTAEVKAQVKKIQFDITVNTKIIQEKDFEDFIYTNEKLDIQLIGQVLMKPKFILIKVMVVL